PWAGAGAASGAIVGGAAGGGAAFPMDRGSPAEDPADRRLPQILARRRLDGVDHPFPVAEERDVSRNDRRARHADEAVLRPARRQPRYRTAGDALLARRGPRIPEGGGVAGPAAGTGGAPS